MGQDRGLAGVEAGLAAQVLGGVGLGAAVQAGVVEWRGLEGHQVGRLQLRPGLGERVGDALVLADGAAEHDALLRIGRRALERGAAQADGFGGEQHPFGVEALQQVFEALPFLADQGLVRDLEVVDEQLLDSTALRPIFGIGFASTPFMSM